MLSKKFSLRRFKRARRLRRRGALGALRRLQYNPPLADSVKYENPPSFQNGE